MTSGPQWLAAIVPTLGLACAAGMIGCSSGGGGMLQRGPSVGSLKTVVSRLEFENEKLRREIADARADSQQIHDQLAQMEAANTDLTARLGQYQGQLGDDPALAGNSGSTGARARPAGSTTTNSRKPPFARIPGQGQALPSLDDLPPDEPPRRRTSRSASPDTSYRTDDDDRWLPIARDTRPVQVR